MVRLFKLLWRNRYPLVIGGVGGILFWGAFNFSMDMSSTETFCISCHEMESTVYQELKGTIHYSNRSGVRAICSDCHVPKPWVYKVMRKIRATFNEVPQHLLGSIDTPEKFEAKRLELAKHVWAEMKASDSRECRNCHEAGHMNFEVQKPRARAQHMDAKETGETCIDCHKGIAHKPVHQLLEEPGKKEDEGFTLGQLAR